MQQNDTYVDTVRAVDGGHPNDPSPVMSDWTPAGGYINLLEATDDAGIDLSEYSIGETIAVAVMDDDGNVLEFYPDGRKVLEIKAEHTGNSDDAAFNVFFERPWDWRFESCPIEEDAATRAIEESYGWGHDPEVMYDGEPLGVLIVDRDGEYVDIHLTR